MNSLDSYNNPTDFLLRHSLGGEDLAEIGFGRDIAISYRGERHDGPVYALMDACKPVYLPFEKVDK